MGTFQDPVFYIRSLCDIFLKIPNCTIKNYQTTKVKDALVPEILNSYKVKCESIFNKFSGLINNIKSKTYVAFNFMELWITERIHKENECIHRYLKSLKNECEITGTVRK